MTAGSAEDRLGLSKLLSVKWQQARMVWGCYTCDEQETAKKPTIDLPPGWRRTYRGFYGTAYICPQCIAEGRKYQRDYRPRKR
jgi:hypothetical protein